jgi:hypothetical protein
MFMRQAGVFLSLVAVSAVSQARDFGQYKNVQPEIKTLGMRRCEFLSARSLYRRTFFSNERLTASKPTQGGLHGPSSRTTSGAKYCISLSRSPRLRASIACRNMETGSV